MKNCRYRKPDRLSCAVPGSPPSHLAHPAVPLAESRAAGPSPVSGFARIVIAISFLPQRFVLLTVKDLSFHQKPLQTPPP
jgi:hypothetical protein